MPCPAAQSKVTMSPAQPAHTKKPLTTLVEEHVKDAGTAHDQVRPFFLDYSLCIALLHAECFFCCHLQADEDEEREQTEDEDEEEVEVDEDEEVAAEEKVADEANEADASQDAATEKEPSHDASHPAKAEMAHSVTSESLGSSEVPAKGCTPSMASSGYGSQAQSLQTLSSEDSLSVRSIDDTPEKGSGGQRADSDGEDSAGSVVCQEQRAPLQQQESLIDAEVPDNLDSPMKPTTPLVETLQRSNTEEQTQQEVEEEEEKKAADCDALNASMDIYSTKALDELEGLSDHNDTFTQTPKKEETPSSKEEEPKEPPAPKEEPSKAVNLRPKSHSVGERNGKPGPSPMKATYRPSSMVMEDHEDIIKAKEDHSGEISHLLCFPAAQAHF